jgi:hypothetical protein
VPRDEYVLVPRRLYGDEEEARENVSGRSGTVGAAPAVVDDAVDIDGVVDDAVVLDVVEGRGEEAATEPALSQGFGGDTMVVGGKGATRGA